MYAIPYKQCFTTMFRKINQFIHQTSGISAELYSCWCFCLHPRVRSLLLALGWHTTEAAGQSSYHRHKLLKVHHAISIKIKSFDQVIHCFFVLCSL